MRVALGTNILVYAEGLNGAERQKETGRVLRDHAEDDLIIPAQARANCSPR